MAMTGESKLLYKVEEACALQDTDHRSQSAWNKEGRKEMTVQLPPQHH